MGAGLLTGLTGCATSSDTRAFSSLSRLAALSADTPEEAMQFAKQAEFLDAYASIQEGEEKRRQAQGYQPVESSTVNYKGENQNPDKFKSTLSEIFIGTLILVAIAAAI